MKRDTLSFKYKRLYASLLAILLILSTPLWKLVINISDDLLISIIVGIGTIAATFTLTEYRKEKFLAKENDFIQGD